jgi:hypothetical protein
LIIFIGNFGEGIDNGKSDIGNNEITNPISRLEYNDINYNPVRPWDTDSILYFRSSCSGLLSLLSCHKVLT